MTYLGVYFKSNVVFLCAKPKLASQTERPLFNVFKNFRNRSVPIDLQLKIFDATAPEISLKVQPIITGCIGVSTRIGSKWGYFVLHPENLSIYIYKLLLAIKSNES